MKLKKIIPFIMLSLLILTQINVFSQEATNRQALEEFAREQNKEWQKMKARAERYAADHNLEIRKELEDGTVIQLVDVEDGVPVYYKTDNLGAAITTRANQLWEGGSVGVVIEGEGYDKVAIWDGGKVRDTHQEFNQTGSSRIILSDGASSLSAHATHVAGTIIAGGVNAEAHGMAKLAQLKTYDWNSVEGEMSAAAANGLELGSHSWGMVRGWDNNSGTWQWNGNTGVAPLEDYQFGFYNSQARSWDIIANNAPNFLIVKSAGNDRGDGPSNAGTGDVPEKDGGDDGYDCVAGAGIAKNILTVGAVNEVLNYTGPSSVVMSSFSGWGPADDGRIKPDVVGKGVDVYSSTSNSNTSYSSYNGTSMSTPNVTGTLALLQQLYQETHDGTPMRASTLKGLVIHTTDEAGPTPGPDYKFGWGLVNAERAANMILEDDVQQNVIDEITLLDGETYTREVTVSGGNPFWVTISWTDPYGIVLPASLNPRTPNLVNDLDLRLEDGDGNMFFPYKLDPENPSAAATTDTKNGVDNVEKIYFDNAPAGTYTIIVDHEGTLANPQVFSLLVSGIDEFTGLPECTAGLLSPADGFDQAFLNSHVEWAPAAFSSGYDVYFGTDGEGVSQPTNIINGETLTTTSFDYNLEPSTTYYLMIQPRNNLGVNNECQTIFSFTTMDAVSAFPYLTDVEEVDTPEFPFGWQGLNYGSMTWETTSLIGNSGTKSFALLTTNGQPAPMNNYLVSQPIVVESGKEYMISFAYRGFLPSTPESLRLLWGVNADTLDLTNEIFNNPSFNQSGWAEGEALLVPEMDGHIFLAFHANTADGRGIFIDDVMVEDWGPVGVLEANERLMRIRYANGKLQINSEKIFENLTVNVTNTAGQQVLNQPLKRVANQTIDLNVDSGVYLVRIQGNGLDKTAKIMVR